MYELSFIAKYLRPKRKQLSSSIIGLISVFIIAAVVWLIVVFFSVANGITNGWIDKLIALTAPVRVTPTDEYYNSYYYLVDSISLASDYTTKSIEEKQKALLSDPYDPELDEEIPQNWPLADRNEKNELKDPIKGLYQSIAEIDKVKGLAVFNFEMAPASLHLNFFTADHQQKAISQGVYLSSFDAENKKLRQSVTPLSSVDLSKLSSKIVLKEPNLHFALQAFYQNANASETSEIPHSDSYGEGMLLPKAFNEMGVSVGDRGFITYQIMTATSPKELKEPIFVAGFYDPGIFPMGSKFLVANRSLVSSIRSFFPVEEYPMMNGVDIRFENRENAL